MMNERRSVSSTARGIAARPNGGMEALRGVSSGTIIAFVVIAFIAVLMVAGCARSKDADVVAGTAASPVNYEGPPAEPASPAPIEATASKGQGVDEGAVVGPDALAPDLAVTMSDTLGLPGTSVQLTARTSPDVVGVTLWDGLGQKQAFVHDSTANLWRASYRVPLGASHGRLGLAVTARNPAGRWQRVWSFLTTAPAEPVPVSESGR
jgi:hypothetical protein